MSPSTDNGAACTAYFSHPSLAYHTPTEAFCIDLCRRELGVSKIINPYDYRGKRRRELGDALRSADLVVGMSVYESYPFLVWNDLSYARSLGKDLYTIVFPSSHSEKIRLCEGIVEGYPHLDETETDRLYADIMNRSSKGLISRMLFGKFGGRTSVF